MALANLEQTRPKVRGTSSRRKGLIGIMPLLVVPWMAVLCCHLSQQNVEKSGPKGVSNSAIRCVLEGKQPVSVIRFSSGLELRSARGSRLWGDNGKAVPIKAYILGTEIWLPHSMLRHVFPEEWPLSSPRYRYRPLDSEYTILLESPRTVIAFAPKFVTPRFDIADKIYASEWTEVEQDSFTLRNFVQLRVILLSNPNFELCYLSLRSASLVSTFLWGNIYIWSFRVERWMMKSFRVVQLWVIHFGTVLCINAILWIELLW